MQNPNFPVVSDPTLNTLRNIRDIMWLKWQAFKRNNPVTTDEPFNHFESVEIAAGETKTFTLSVDDPRNRIYYLRCVDFSYYDDVEYRLSKDGKTLIIPMLTAVMLNGIKFEPPVIVYKNIVLKVTNNSRNPLTISWACSGWKRFK